MRVEFAQGDINRNKKLGGVIVLKKMCGVFVSFTVSYLIYTAGDILKGAFADKNSCAIFSLMDRII
jgi:hypothetical protein